MHSSISINVALTRCSPTKLKTNHQTQLSIVIVQQKQITPHATSKNTICLHNNNIIIKWKPTHTKIATPSRIITCAIRMTCQLTMEWFFLSNRELVVQMDLIFFDSLLFKNVVEHSNRDRRRNTEFKTSDSYDEDKDKMKEDDDVIKQLINKQDEKTGDTLLIIACSYFNENIIRFLIRNGVDVNITNKNNKKVNDLTNFLIKHRKKKNNSNFSITNNLSNASTSSLSIDDSFGQFNELFNEAQQFNTNTYTILNVFEPEKHDSEEASELTDGEEEKDGDGAGNSFIAPRSAISTSRLIPTKVEKNKNGNGANDGDNVIAMHILHQYLVLLMIQQLILIILHQLLIILTVLIDILHSGSDLVIVIYIAIKIQLFILIQWIFYHFTRVFLLLLLLLLLKTIESRDIGLIQVNYDLIQVFICLFTFNYIITGIHWLEQLLFAINYTNNKMEFFLVFVAVFFVVFYTTQHGYGRKNGSGKATNASLIEKPNGSIVNIIIIEQVQALFTRLIRVQVITSIVLNMVSHIIDINFERKSYLDMNKHQNIFVNRHIICTLLSQQKYYKSSYIVL